MIEIMWDVAVNFALTDRNYINLINDFKKLWQFPYCFGEIGCHIPIKYPPQGQESAKEYLNVKNVYSIVLMAIADGKYRFVWANCAIPRNSFDSELYQQMTGNDLIPNIGNIAEEQIVAVLLLGDSAFSFRTLLLKPFANAILVLEQIYFS